MIRLFGWVMGLVVGVPLLFKAMVILHPMVLSITGGPCPSLTEVNQQLNPGVQIERIQRDMNELRVRKESRFLELQGEMTRLGWTQNEKEISFLARALVMGVVKIDRNLVKQARELSKYQELERLRRAGKVIIEDGLSPLEVVMSEFRPLSPEELSVMGEARNRQSQGTTTDGKL